MREVVVSNTGWTTNQGLKNEIVLVVSGKLDSVQEIASLGVKSKLHPQYVRNA